MILTYYKNIKRNYIKSNKRINKFATKKNTRFGICLDSLSNIYKSFLQDRWFTRYIADDDQILNIVFHCFDIENDRKSYDKIYYLNHLNRLTTKNKIKYFSNIFKWHCSICEKDIEIDINKKTKHRDLVCEDCLQENVRILDERVVSNYTELSKYILNKIKKDHSYLNRKIKKNREL